MKSARKESFRSSAELSVGSVVSRRAVVKALGISAIALCSASASAPRALALSPKAKKSKKPASYKIVYKLDGGANPASQILTVTRNKKVSVSKLKVPKRKGYKFTGWYSDSSCSVRAKTIAGVSKAAKRRVYASWKPKTYKISCDMGGGQQVITLPTSYTIESSSITLRHPVRDGYAFTGWYSDSALSQKKTKVKKGSTGNLKLYAGWSPVDYWDKHLEEKCAVINALAAEAEGSPASFVFITDMHLLNNAFVSPYLVKQVIGRTGASMVVFGGDALNYHSTRSDAVDLLGSVRTMFGGLEFHYVRGNHDANTYNSNAVAEVGISDAEFLSLTRGTNEVREGSDLYYYRDDAMRHVRYLFLDSGVTMTNVAHIDNAQLSWLRERILELDEKWTVLIMVHRFFNAKAEVPTIFSPSRTLCGIDLIRAIDGVYEEASATIAGVVSGHCHRDYAEYPSAKGYPYFATVTTCDAYGKVSSDPWRARAKGTDDEHAFDVVTLDTDAKMVYLTRIGWGSDRCFSYAPEPALPESGSSGNSGAGDSYGGSSGSGSSNALRAAAI